MSPLCIGSTEKVAKTQQRVCRAIIMYEVKVVQRSYPRGYLSILRYYKCLARKRTCAPLNVTIATLSFFGTPTGEN
jgi:hypothetical protein